MMKGSSLERNDIKRRYKVKGGVVTVSDWKRNENVGVTGLDRNNDENMGVAGLDRNSNERKEDVGSAGLNWDIDDEKSARVRLNWNLSDEREGSGVKLDWHIDEIDDSSGEERIDDLTLEWGIEKYDRKYGLARGTNRCN